MLSYYPKRLLLTLFVILCTTIGAQAQISVEAKLDTANILIGEQVQLRVKCSMPAGQQADWPYFQPKQQLTKGVEVVNNGRIDTIKLNDGKRIELTRCYTITSFDSALYAIPPIVVKVNGKEYASHGNLGFKVSTLAVDTVHIDKFNGPHGVVDLPFEWSWRITLMALAAILAALGAIILFIRMSDPRLITRRVVIMPPVPAHISALTQIEHIRQKPANDPKEYYTALTDTLRSYLEQRFGFNALEMTTAEIIDELCASDNQEAMAELKEVLIQADLVKFAKHRTSLSEQDRSLVLALNYVQTTKVEPIEKPKPRVEFQTLSDKKQHSLRNAMTIGSILLSLTALLLLAATLYDLYNCFG